MKIPKKNHREAIRLLTQARELAVDVRSGKIACVGDGMYKIDRLLSAAKWHLGGSK